MCVCVCLCVLGGTVTVPVIDVCQVSVHPPARAIPVNCPALTRVLTGGAGDAELAVSVRCTYTASNRIAQFTFYTVQSLICPSVCIYLTKKHENTRRAVSTYSGQDSKTAIVLNTDT